MHLNCDMYVQSPDVVLLLVEGANLGVVMVTRRLTVSRKLAVGTESWRSAFRMNRTGGVLYTCEPSHLNMTGGGVELVQSGSSRNQTGSS